MLNTSLSTAKSTPCSIYDLNKIGTKSGELTLFLAEEESESCLLEKSNLVSNIPQVRDKVASLNIDRELLASGAVHKNLHLFSSFVSQKTN